MYTTVDGQIRLPRPPKIGIPKPPSNDTPRPPSADEAPGGQSWFSAIARFRRGYDPNLTVAEDRAKFISPYLECYAKKHSLDKNKVGSYYRTFNGVNEYEIKNILKEELPELAKLEKEFKAMFPSRPNNGKSIDDNPAIWDEILTNRDEYYQCAVNDLPDATDCNRLSDSDRVVMQSFKEDMQKTLDDIRSFSTGRNWFVRDFNDSRNEYLLAALRPSFFKDLNAFKQKLFTCSGLLDQIASEAKQTLPKYHLVGYSVRNAAEEKLIRGHVNDLHHATVHKSGFGSAVWTIQKNAFGIPEKRYKHGAIWAKYPVSITEDGFCRIIYLNIIQDYAGGGTYGASYPYFVKSELAGCPAGK
ncbi:MAG: hypothetical protein KF685_07815 [Acidobacteria bacterium]|nr:hypothetical protein [Acidobacteriota bacterium]